MKIKKNTIIVTGGGGVTGRAIARCLRLSEHFGQFDIVATDIYENEFGAFEGLYDRCYKINHVDHSEYFSDFSNVCSIENPAAVLIMTEKETLFWSNSNPDFPTIILPPQFSEEVISKYQLYMNLEHTEFVPKFRLIENNPDGLDILASAIKNNESVWVRAFNAGSSSGKGAFLVRNMREGKAWFDLNPEIEQFLLSEYLPGRNFACCLLYLNGKLLQYAIYERLKYFMPHISISGITGNISKGKLVNEHVVVEVSDQVVRLLCDKFNEIPNGLVTVDLKGDLNDSPKVTEINLRHTAATSAFAAAGWNMAEFQVLAITGKKEFIPKEKPYFPDDNLILRDIDGIPVYLEHYTDMRKNRIIRL